MAERLGTGLQNRLQQFESAWYLSKDKSITDKSGAFLITNFSITNYELRKLAIILDFCDMKTNNVIQHKTFAFAVRVVNLYKYLNAKLDEKVLSKQLLRCGTSIGANIEEAIGGQSERDFYAKLTISYKEAREARYWIKLLKETLYLSEQEANSLLVDIEEICKIIGSIQKAIKFRNT